MAAPSVQHTVDFDRIRALPRRTFTLEDMTRWAEVFTAEFRDPRAPSSVCLLPEQGISLAEAAENGGAWIALPVGFGKTLITYLLPRLFDAERPLLIAPASLRDKTWADFAAYEGQWLPPQSPIRFMSREDLARPTNAQFLNQYRPDLVICDEGHKLSNADAGAPARLDRYRADNPGAVFVVLSGTPSRKSIMGYWHTLGWCLPHTMPLPFREGEARLWAAALDERNGREFQRVDPGPLGADRDAALEWYARRLAETPGVVIIDGDSCDAPLTFRWRFAREDAVLDEHFARFTQFEEDPGGTPVTDPLSRWTLDGRMGCGVYSYYDPPPPEEWRETRRDFARFVRGAIEASRRGYHPLDTEAQVVAHNKTHPRVVAWRDIKPTFKPHTKHRWLTDSAVDSAIDWLRESEAPGIVWSGCVEYGQRVAERAGVPYFGRLGKSAEGMSLHDPPKGMSFVASWHANREGLNLQDWTRHLVTMAPQSAQYLEQIVGRSHRRGQFNPVTIDVLMTSGGTIDAFESAIREAMFSKSSVSLTQKILRAEIIRSRPRITASNEFRWASKTRIAL